MVSDEALKKLQEQIAAWPMTQRFVVQQLIEDYLRAREDMRAYEATWLAPEEGGGVMERLTKRDNDGQAMMDCEKCKADWTGKNGKPMVDCTALYCRNRLKDRLAAYEDRGCAPEEVLPKDKADEIALKLMRLADLENFCSYTRLRELAEADKDGRLVVLPFSDADYVEMRRDGITYKSDHWNILLTAFSDDYPTLSGRKLGVFSVKEAEEALEAKKNE